MAKPTPPRNGLRCLTIEDDVDADAHARIFQPQPVIAGLDPTVKDNSKLNVRWGVVMEIAPISISLLRLNPHNDRHGPLRDESASIQWLLENRTLHMRALARDLVKTKRLFEYPLVRQEGECFVVFDGNRRTCCIKLLHDPSLAPSEEWTGFFKSLHFDGLDAHFLKVDCEVEQDLQIIDEKLYRRHTGSQEGVGQSQWDPAGKSFFLQRTGKDSIGLGQSIETVLKAEGLLASNVELPWSNLERLLSSEQIRKRVGISFSGGSLSYLTDKKENLQTLQKIANDLTKAKDRIVLGDLWNSTMKAKYIDGLKIEGYAVDNVPSARTDVEDDEKVATSVESTKTRARRRAPKDKSLIASADNNPFFGNPEVERAERIWRELQFELEFDRHENAIAVLMRVLLDISITYYARKNGIVFAHNDTFAKRVGSVADSLLARGFIDNKGRSIIRKFESDKPIVSAHSMHQYVHNPNFHPGKSDLIAIWQVIRPIVISSVR